MAICYAQSSDLCNWPTALRIQWIPNPNHNSNSNPNPTLNLNPEPHSNPNQSINMKIVGRHYTCPGAQTVASVKHNQKVPLELFSECTGASRVVPADAISVPADSASIPYNFDTSCCHAPI